MKIHLKEDTFILLNFRGYIWFGTLWKESKQEIMEQDDRKVSTIFPP